MNQFRRKEHACKAKLTKKLNEDGSFTFKPSKVEHTHINDVRDKMAKERVDEATKTAMETNTTTRELLAQSLSGAPTELLSQMPNANTFGKAIRNARQGIHLKAPKCLEDLVLENILTTTGNNFIHYDSGVVDGGRLVMFSTSVALDFLEACEIFFMDGTVRSGPVLFDQVYTIHGVYIYLCALFLI